MGNNEALSYIWNHKDLEQTQECLDAFGDHIANVLVEQDERIKNACPIFGQWTVRHAKRMLVELRDHSSSTFVGVVSNFNHKWNMQNYGVPWKPK